MQTERFRWLHFHIPSTRNARRPHKRRTAQSSQRALGNWSFARKQINSTNMPHALQIPKDAYSMIMLNFESHALVLALSLIEDHQI